MITKPGQKSAVSSDCHLLNADDDSSFFGEDYAEAYDDIMARRVSYASWIDYFEDVTRTFHCQVSKLLDAACGTGTFAMLALDRGFNVVGVDASPAMLERFRRKVGKHVNSRQCRIIDSYLPSFEIIDHADAAVCFFDSLNYIVKEDQFASALCRISSALRSGGIFVFDVNNEIAYTQNLFQQSGRVDSAKSSVLEFDWSGQYCAQHSLYQLELSFMSHKNSLRFRERHMQRFYPREAIEQYLGLAGFGVVRCFRGFSFAQGSALDERWSFIAIKN